MRQNLAQSLEVNMHAKICTKSNMSEQIDLQEIYGLCLVEMTMFRNLGVPRILQWRGFTGLIQEV